MSLRYEQYNSLKRTKEFLQSLLSHETRPKTVKELREKTYRCLRHFPPLHASGQPYWSQDDLTLDYHQELPQTSPAPEVKKCQRKPS
jgi:hypothetical protein